MRENRESLDLILLYMYLSHHQNAGQNRSITVANKAKENSSKIKYLRIFVFRLTTLCW